MNGKSVILYECRLNIHVSRYQLMNWFVNNNGKEYSPKEKPPDIPTHCAMRLRWCVFKLNNPFIPIAYLNEKFFYNTNRKQKFKKLPPRPLETTSDVNAIIPKILNHQFPIEAILWVW